jgi:hypothetical protein
METCTISAVGQNNSVLSSQVSAQPIARPSAAANEAKQQHEQLQALITKLMTFACERPNAPAPISLANTTVHLSPSEWQALTCSFADTEQSFRADLNRIVLRAVGLSAAMQEELALYRVRVDTKYLWEKHWTTLSYLQSCAEETLPKLEWAVSECRHRGLLKKAGELNGLLDRLTAQHKEVVESKPDEATVRMSGLGFDPKIEDNRLQRLTAHLVGFAGTTAERTSIPLPNTSLIVNETEWDALAGNQRETEKSFRADLGRTLRRSIAIAASIQEELTLYAASEIKYQKKSHLNSLLYLNQSASALLPEVEAAAEEARQRGLSKKAEDVSETAMRTRRYTDTIAAIYEDWKRNNSKPSSVTI